MSIEKGRVKIVVVADPDKSNQFIQDLEKHYGIQLPTSRPVFGSKFALFSLNKTSDHLVHVQLVFITTKDPATFSGLWKINADSADQIIKLDESPIEIAGDRISDNTHAAGGNIQSFKHAFEAALISTPEPDKMQHAAEIDDKVVSEQQPKSSSCGSSIGGFLRKVEMWVAERKAKAAQADAVNVNTIN